MNRISKHFIPFLFTIVTCVAASSVEAQSWTEANSGNANPCSNNSGSGSGQCYCAQGYTFGTTNSNGTNCTYSGSIAGCWNPDNNGQGTCQACGDGGTVALVASICAGACEVTPTFACYGGINGQQNWNGAFPSVPSASGAACTQNSECQSYNAGCTATNSSGVCTNWGGGPSSGGYSSNSDIRLKRDIVLLGQTEQGIKLYSFKYLWSDQVYVGVMAQDLLENPKWQDAVITNPNGYYSVNYSKLGLEMVTLEQYQQHSTVALVK